MLEDTLFYGGASHAPASDAWHDVRDPADGSRVGRCARAAVLGRFVEAGVSAGVLANMPGTGPEAGAALARHPGIACISAMASVAAGPPGYIEGTGYGLEQGPLLSPFMMPCTAPPWARLVAVDMAQGTVKWEMPLGLIDKLAPVPIPFRWGTPYAGGPIATGGGLVFIGATADERFRAYDTHTGELLWEFEGPTSANATPMTYMVGGKQYVVVATGGHNWVYPWKKGDTVGAYSLPD